MTQQKIVKVLIAEDEPSSRTFLRNILTKQADFAVVGEASNGAELVELGSVLKPDAVFVDIDMPGMDGMSAVKKLIETNEDLIVVFVTGYADFAVEAFEISSFDYIMKPYKADRVVKTLDKIRAHYTEREQDMAKLAKVFKADKLYIKCGHELHFVETRAIYYIEKERKKTIIHTLINKYEAHESLNDLEERLNPADFFRSHKCYIINLRMVEKILPWGDNSYLVRFLNSNNDALISRAKVKLLYELLNIEGDQTVGSG